jgi:predicted dehydrogenase
MTSSRKEINGFVESHCNIVCQACFGKRRLRGVQGLCGREKPAPSHGIVLRNVPRREKMPAAMKCLTVIVLILTVFYGRSENLPAPVPLAIVGLAHGAAGHFLAALPGCTGARLVGILETNELLAAQYQARFNLDKALFYTNFDQMCRARHPQAVAVFTRTLDHCSVVEECAAIGIDVLLEKPLAVNLAEARRLASVAQKANIEIMVNYDTTWYPAHQGAYDIVHNHRLIGAVRKMVVRAGHRGPKETGCSPAVLEWLTDPAQSGGGALVDFGCYGANLVTWMMDGELPKSVMAMTQHIKPAVYPKVEDEATIVLEYPAAQAIIQASWNWPFEIHDLEIFGRDGYVFAPQKDLLRVRKAGSEESEIKMDASPAEQGFPDEVSYLIAVVRRQIRPTGLTSMKLNLTVTEILDAAKDSARTGRRVDLPAGEAAP